MLNAQQIIEEKLLRLDNTHGKPAQVGYDLSVKEINSIGASGEKVGKILKSETKLTDYSPVKLMNFEGNEGWLLHPGEYDVVFNEGCDIPSDRMAFIKQRSSLRRNGAKICSPLFDPGFSTENMGTCMTVEVPIFIEKNARIAQIYFHESTPTDNLYNGQFQGDSQRNQ